MLTFNFNALDDAAVIEAFALHIRLREAQTLPLPDDRDIQQVLAFARRCATDPAAMDAAIARNPYKVILSFYDALADDLEREL